MALLFFFFKQKTAYEMRISDWSSDVCSSDLGGPIRASGGLELVTTQISQLAIDAVDTVIVPGGGDACTAAAHAPLIHWLVDTGGRVRPLCSLYLREFHLGRARLRDGRTGTHPWSFRGPLPDAFTRAEIQKRQAL